MVGPVGASRINIVGNVRVGGTRTRAGAAMQGLAGKVATAFAQEFDLLGEHPPRRQYRPEIDPYDIDATAKELNRGLGGGAVDEGRFVRSLGQFVAESASLVGARPESRSLAEIDASIARAEGEVRGPETVDGALRSIDRTATLIAGEVRR